MAKSPCQLCLTVTETAMGKPLFKASDGTRRKRLRCAWSSGQIDIVREGGTSPKVNSVSGLERRCFRRQRFALRSRLWRDSPMSVLEKLCNVEVYSEHGDTDVKSKQNGRAFVPCSAWSALFIPGKLSLQSLGPYAQVKVSFSMPF